MENNLMNSLKSKAEIDYLFAKNAAFFGYGEGVSYERVVELFGEESAKAGMPLATVRVIPAASPDEEDTHFVFFPGMAFRMAAGWFNMETEKKRVAEKKRVEALRSEDEKSV